MTRKSLLEFGSTVALLLSVMVVVGGFLYSQERQRCLDRQLYTTMDNMYYRPPERVFLRLEKTIRQGADVGTRSNTGLTVLMLGAMWHNVETVKLALVRGADVDARDQGGFTPLMYAAAHGHLDVTQLLLSRGAKPDVRDKDGETALMVAASQGHGPVVELLLKSGADVNVRSNAKETALLKATYGARVGIMRILIREGALVNAADRYDFTPLNVVASRPRVPGGCSEVQVTEAARLLLERGAHVAIRDVWGNTALSEAKKQGHKDMMQLLKVAAAKQ